VFVISFYNSQYAKCFLTWQMSNDCHFLLSLHGCFLGAFKKLRKRLLTASSPPVRPSVHIEQLGSHWTDCHESWYMMNFPISIWKTHVSLQSDKNNGYFTWRPIYISPSVLRMKIFQTKVAEKLENTLYVQYIFLRKLCCLWDNVEKILCGGAGYRRMRIACWILMLKMHTQLV
jgi:hypothetical protein